MKSLDFKTVIKKNYAILLLIVFLSLTSFILIPLQDHKPTLYLIGDSTVKNGKGKGDGNLWGWGNYIASYFDTTRIIVNNNALGGRSSRTFISGGNWEKVLSQLKPGDFVMMQFGHNDGGALDDTARARGTIKGTGEEFKEIYNPILKKHEVVYTYGWYMRKFVNDTKEKGATPIICSPIPRNDWKEGRVNREEYAKWAEETAKTTKTFFIPLNTIIANKYDKIGQDSVKPYFTSIDHTHTNDAGAKLNALSVIEGLKTIKRCPLQKYLLKKNNNL
ncbi:MAG: rhamnogalacturonan acetylesterase [Bacteroidetes bacterium]|nr:rhamnogalacturonan acetylesterase [Bacteroidota bacterium]